MSWDSSNRRLTLPPDWGRVRLRVLKRDNYKCQLKLECCTGSATEVDHINSPEDHSALQAVCSACHARKSSQQGSDRKKALKALRLRPEGNHPGRR